MENAPPGKQLSCVAESTVKLYNYICETRGCVRLKLQSIQTTCSPCNFVKLVCFIDITTALGLTAHVT